MSLTDGLQLHLEGPTGVTDLSGNGRDGTYFGGMGTTSSDGRLAFLTDGVDDYIALPVVSLPSVFPYTLSFWIKTNTTGMIALTRSDVNNRWIYYNATPTHGRLTTRNATSINQTITTANSATADTWIHLCFLIESRTSRRVILNGDIANSTFSSVDSFQTVPNLGPVIALTVGAHVKLAGITYFSQLTDSIRTYNRILSSDEITQLATERGVTNSLQSGSVLHLEGPTGLTDLSGNGYVGSYVGGMGTAVVDGRLAFSFDGINDYINYGDILDMGTSDWTIACWIKTADTTCGVIGKTRDGVGARWAQYIAGTTTVVSLFSDGTTIYSPVTSSSVNDGTWRHFATTFNRDGMMTTYVDGVSIATSDISSKEASDLQSAYSLFIGAYVSNTGSTPLAGYYLNGSMDSIRVFNRVINPLELSVLASSRGATGSGATLLLMQQQTQFVGGL